jgi:hypothetical protein
MTNQQSVLNIRHYKRISAAWTLSRHPQQSKCSNDYTTTYIFFCIVDHRWWKCMRSLGISDLMRYLIAFGQTIDEVLFVFDEAQPHINLKFGLDCPPTRSHSSFSWQLYNKHTTLNIQQIFWYGRSSDCFKINLQTWVYFQQIKTPNDLTFWTTREAYYSPS